MIVRAYLLSILAVTACGLEKPVQVSPVAAAASIPAAMQRQGFITVEGADLKSRLDSAVKLGRAASGRYWTAYSFDVRPGVGVDIEWWGDQKNGDRTSISSNSKPETRNLGVFLLHEPKSDAVVRVQVYNLEREREYSGYRVYWLARANNEESLNLLRGLVEGPVSTGVNEHAAMAIALHDDPRIGGMLKDFVRQSATEKVRTSAVFWLGQIGGETAFLADLLRNENENREVRKQAAFAIGVGKDRDALSTLQGIYPSITDRDVKNQIIFAASINEDKEEAINFLIKTASNDTDRESRRQAIFWLGQKAGERSLGALRDTVEHNDSDTEVQKQAVFAISQRPREEAVPLLIKIAKTHSKAEVRKQAIFWLGQTGDERAIDLFKELLSK